MKTLKWLTVLTMLGAAVLLGTFTAYAQEPLNTSPATALYIDNVAHTIPAKTTLYYRFEYAGDNSPVRAMLLNAANGNLAMNVYTPEQLNLPIWWLLPPIGRGTDPGCGNPPADPEVNKICRPFANDLMWEGKFYGPGPYYVQVQNYSDVAQEFTLTAAGPSVRLCPISTEPCPPMVLIPYE